ncbi:NUDIX domain-containing protein [Streptomyces brasiliscabiei]|uniref:NUDIX domain-containing protein n=1 Tax=Streptomyces brasiliscabiei TaxID=2736302 RepID=UPI001F18027E|nr:NUDIX domain-containing protein [Streptomyces brasiliscabiei]
MTSPPPSDSAPHGTAMPAAAYSASRAALWTGVSVLITDTAGRILLERVTYRTTRLLPGGGVDPEEAPARAAAREVLEELGVHLPISRTLAVDWVPRTTPGYDPATFPGEIIYVFDGGTWDSEQIAAIRPRPGEIEDVDFVDPDELPALMAPGNARRALAALHARATDGAVVLEDGYPITPPPPAS